MATVTWFAAAHRSKGIQPPEVNWSLIIEPDGRPGHENMAVDHTLLTAAREGNATLRLYRWDPPSLSFGRNESAFARYDRGRVSDLGLACVRRPTGGRAVWHDLEVTYAVAAPVTAFGALRDTYLAVHRMLASSLHVLGATVALAAPAPRTPGIGAGACFAAPVGGEILSDMRKLAGSAQVREGSAFLQHGSVLLSDRQDVVAQITRSEPPATTATGMDTVLGRPVEFGEVADAVASTARSEWAGAWRTVDPPMPSAELLAHYTDPDWTWRR